MTDGVQLTIGASVASAIIGAAAAWLKTRTTQKTASRIEPQPLSVELKSEFADRVKNETDHTDLFGRVAKLEQQSGEMKGTLSAIRDDVLIVKNILMNGGGRK